MQLHPEGAADVGRDDAHAGFRDAVVTRIEVLELIRRLRRMVDGQAHLARVVIGDDRARLQRHGGMPAEAELLLHDMRRPGEDQLGAAGVDLSVEADVVSQAGRHQRGTRRAGGIDVGDGGQFLELDHHRLGRVFGLGPGVGHHSHHGLSGPHGPVERQGQLRRRFHALEMVQRAGPRRADARQVFAGRDQPHAGHRQRRRDVDRDDAGMGVGAAQEGGMQHPRQHQVGDIAAVPGQQALGVGPRNRSADIGVRPIDGAEGRVHASSSTTSPARRRATSWMASTIAS